MRSTTLFLVVCIAIFMAAIGLGSRYASSMASARGTQVRFGSGAVSKRTSTATGNTAAIQTGARVINVTDSHGWTTVGIMAAYEPRSRSFWWRPTPLIAEPSMLERFFERCKFVMDGGRVTNVCVRGNEVVTTTTAEYRASFDEGVAKAEQALKENPGLMMQYTGPRDWAFSLKSRAGLDMDTPTGVAPTVVRSVTSTGSGLAVYVTCGCGDVVIDLNRAYDFVSVKKG